MEGDVTGSTLADIVKERAAWKAAGRRVVFTNGCFDLLHPGHIALFESARAEGDLLVVGLNSDRSVRVLKGEGRPLIPQDERAETLLALEPVDRVVIYDDDTPRAVIAALLPDVLVKGADWAADAIVGREEVEAAGGRVVRVGIVPGGGGTQLLARRVSVARAKELVFTGRRISGEIAHEWGMVTTVVPRAALAAATAELATEVCRSSPVGVREAKFAIDRGTEVPLQQGLELEELAWRRAVLSDDRQHQLPCSRGDDLVGLIRIAYRVPLIRCELFPHLLVVAAGDDSGSVRFLWRVEEVDPVHVAKDALGLRAAAQGIRQPIEPAAIQEDRPARSKRKPRPTRPPCLTPTTPVSS